MSDLAIVILCVWLGGFLWLCRKLIPMLVYDRATMTEQMQAVAIWIVWPISLPIIHAFRRRQPPPP